MNESVDRYFRAAILVALGVLLFSVEGDRRVSLAPPNEPAYSKTIPAASSNAFLGNLPMGLDIPDKTDEVSLRVLADYGAVFVARGGSAPPPCVIFLDDAAVDKWQKSVKSIRVNLGGISIALQPPAMTALLEARAEARKSGHDISPLDRYAARRSYADTVTLWKSRVNPGLAHWVREGRLTRAEVARIRSLSARNQVPEVLRLEKNGLYFSEDFSKSILYSVAAPGASQHLSLLALDVNQHEDQAVRSILARHGWFQTVLSDAPHFTFLGVNEDQLLSLGLKSVTAEGRTFWIPRME
jgi:hypothetical protein